MTKMEVYSADDASRPHVESKSNYEMLIQEIKQTLLACSENQEFGTNQLLLMGNERHRGWDLNEICTST